MTDPTQALLEAMAKYDLDPGTITWDDQIHRFPGPGKGKRNDDGWYVAWADQRGAVFGDWPRGIKENWKANGQRPDDMSAEDWAEARARMDEEAKQRAAEREAATKALQEEVAEAARKRWARASLEVDLSHPYLQAKGVEKLGPGWIKQEKDRLLIAMKEVSDGDPIISLQVIYPDGKKRFVKQSRTEATRTTIGASAFKKNPTLYVCEGWATGWTVHHVTGCATVVAFSCGNLRAVVEWHRKKYPDARIIVCADNDRWSTTWVDGEEVQNPGVWFARDLLRDLDNVEVAIPEFTDLEGKPTDFNDLYTREGADAVMYWLDPDRAELAVTTKEPPAAKDEGKKKKGKKEKAKAEPASERWYENPHFRVLGYDSGQFFYLPRASGQLVGLSAGAHAQRTQLLQVAPLPFWEKEFPGKQGVDWTVATDALYQRAYTMGVFSVERSRGRGCWPTEDRTGVVLHLGDRLLPPDGKEFVKPEAYDGGDGSIYQRRPRIVGPSDERVLDREKATEVLDLFRDLMWHDDASGYLLAGWTVLAPMCGALPWRPHVWLTGHAGSGKSTIIRDLVVPLTGGTGLYVEGQTTEAGIRQKLRDDARPVIYDEAEVTGTRAEGQIQAVLRLIRSASSTGAETYKGSTRGEAVAYQIRSMFCLASIGGAIKTEADKSRVSLLQLMAPPDDPRSQEAIDRQKHWRAYKPRLSRMVKDERVGRELLARSLGWLRDGRLEQAFMEFKTAAESALGSARAGDQYGTLIAGAWTLMSDEPPTTEEARAVIESMGLDTYISEQVPDGIKLIQVLLQQRERIDTRNGPQIIAVGQMIDALCDRSSPVLATEADEFLKQVGLKVDVMGGERVLHIAHSSEWIARALADTPYASNVWPVLRSLQGARPGGQVRFHPGLACRTTAVPVHVLERTETGD